MIGSKVTFTKLYNSADEIVFLKEEAVGLFQRWADDIFYFNERYFAKTVALILDTNGQIIRVVPDSIKKIDAIEQAPKLA